MELVVVYMAPIPVGHRVEVTWTEEVRRGLVPGQERTDARPHQPVLRDLDTGVTYATDWSLGSGRRRGPDLPHDVGDAVLADHRVARVVTGTVQACRVVTLRGTPTFDVQTHLTLTLD